MTQTNFKNDGLFAADITAVNHVEIEREARRLQAEAIRHGFLVLRGHIRRAFALIGQRKPRTA